MKTLSKPRASGISGFLKGCIAILGLAAAAPTEAKTFGQVSISLAQQKFGHGQTISASSGDKHIYASQQYKFNLTGTVMPEPGSALAKIIAPGTPIAKFVDSLAPGDSKYLKGTFSNPGGTLPKTVYNRTFGGTKNVKGIGAVKINFKVVAKILASGECELKVTNVVVSTNPAQKLGYIQFQNGSKLTLTAAPVVAFLKATKTISEDNPFVDIQVTRLNNFKGAVSVDFETVGITADTTDDFVAANGTVQFADGQKSANVRVNLIDNAVNDGPRTFKVNLLNPSKGCFVGTFPSVTVTIGDND